jgi:hypothetical protein
VREKSAVLIQQDLAKIGVKTKIRMVDFATEVVQLGKERLTLDCWAEAVQSTRTICGSISILPAQIISPDSRVRIFNMMDKARTLQTRQERIDAYNKCRSPATRKPRMSGSIMQQLGCLQDIFEIFNSRFRNDQLAGVGMVI